MKCDWEAAKRILDERPELVRYSLTEKGETALHVAASVKRSKHVEKFVKNLMGMMDREDLELINDECSTALYLASATGNIKMVRIMLKKNRELNLIPGGYWAERKLLYTAASHGNHEMTKYLYGESSNLSSDDWGPTNRRSLLEKCVEADMFDVALKIVKCYPELGGQNVLLNLARMPDAFTETKWGKIKRNTCAVLTLIGLKAGGAFGKENEASQLLKIITDYISNLDKSQIDEILKGPADSYTQDPDIEDHIQAIQVQKLIHELCDKLKVETENIMKGAPTSINQLDATENLDRAKQLQLMELISGHVMNMHVETKNMLKQDNKKGDKIMKLKHLISEHIQRMHDETIDPYAAVYSAYVIQCFIFARIENMYTETAKIMIPPSQTYSSRVLFVAAEMGNTKLIVELIRQYPDLIWKVNDNNQSIFHIAVKYRREVIYNLLYEIGPMKKLITPLKDQSDNNILHLAGKNAPKDRLADVSGPYLQMQRELLWFKEVRNMIPPSYREQKNIDGLTPHELFTEEHKELVSAGEKWMKEMASQCMVVAALIATIVFAAAFTVPGGYNQNDGIPIFYQKVTFVAFVVADAISLFLSSASILTFLSLLTSRYAERDFMESLPRRLMLGLATLFLSITAMMITFGVSFFVLYHNEMKWIPISISVIAVMPVLLYVWLQHHLLLDVLRSSYGSKYLFKPQKQLLY